MFPDWMVIMKTFVVIIILFSPYCDLLKAVFFLSALEHIYYITVPNVKWVLSKCLLNGWSNWLNVHFLNKLVFTACVVYWYLKIDFETF